MKDILISGLSGFVGTNLNEYLKRNSCTIIDLARNDKGTTNSFTWDKVDQLKEAHLDAYVHLAGKAHDLKNTSDPEEYFKVNTELTKKLFDIFLESDAKTFIYFSSVKAAADTVPDILYEDVDPDPRTVYGQSKLQAEQYLLSKSIPENKRLYILRPCMIHGPGNKGNLNMLYKFVNKGIPYPLAGFNNSRSFLSVENLCFIVNKLLDQSAPSGIYNMADDEALSTVELVRVISATLDRKPRLWKISPSLLKRLAKIGDVLKLPLNSERLKKLTESYVVSNEKIKAALHINELPVTARSGLIKTIKSFYSNN